MTTVIERRQQDPDAVVFLCDCSPPRSPEAGALQGVARVGVDFACVAHNPGNAVRVSSLLAAAWLRRETGQEVVFNLATRDMNKLAVQSLLLGAELIGIENVVVVQGDRFNERDRDLVQSVDDFTPTALLAAIRDMNEGVDFRGRKLAAPTHLCAGATIDLGRDVDREVALTARKVEAGSRFFLLQPPWDPARVERFLEQCASAGRELRAPLFVGLQVMEQGSIAFGDVPPSVTADLEAGRPGADIAVEGLHDLVERGFRSIYLVPPILQGGRRDYAAAAAVLEAYRS